MFVFELLIIVNMNNSKVFVTTLFNDTQGQGLYYFCHFSRSRLFKKTKSKITFQVQGHPIILMFYVGERLVDI